MRYMIVDDDADFARSLRERLANCGASENGSDHFTVFASPREASDSAIRGADIIFADINFQDGGADGIGFAKRANSVNPDCCVIFVTSFVEYCSDVYETEHAYFLRKPLTDGDLERALKKAAGILGAKKRRLYLTVGGETVCLRPESVLYFESNYRKVTAFTDDGSMVFYSKLAQVAEQTDTDFVQCHKSFIVNLSRASSMEKERFIMDNGDIVPISRSMAPAARDAFFAYLGR